MTSIDVINALPAIYCIVACFGILGRVILHSLIRIAQKI